MKERFFLFMLAFALFGLGLYIGSETCTENHTPIKAYEDVTIGGNIDIEYYLEVSEDSIWVESVNTKKVYSGKYSDLDSLIIQDNL